MRYILFLFLSGLFFISCNNEGLHLNEIADRWEVISATRNGKPTRTLDKTYFVFDINNKMTTNLFGSDQENDFEFDGEIVEGSGQQKNKYKLSLLSDTLTIKTSIKRYDFEMRAVRADISTK